MKRSNLVIIVILCSLISCKAPIVEELDVNIQALIKKDGTFDSPDGKATLIINGNCRILKLSGTPGERGYNYGYLLAAEIVDLINNYVVYIAKTNYQKAYDSQSLCEWSKWNNDYVEELKGMLDGINTVLTENQRRIYPQNKPSHVLTLVDLKILNTVADWANAFGCSSFAIWGQGRSDGSALLARNLDYFYDAKGIITKRHVIISYNLPSGRKWVSISFTGIIGCISGMNDAGLSMVMQNTNGYLPSGNSGYVPRCLALRYALETLTSNSTPSDAEALFDQTPVFLGNNFLTCFKSNGRIDDNVASVIEYDGKADHPDGRATLRKPSDNFSLYDDHAINYSYEIVNTNHYLKRKTYIDPCGSKDRYLIIKNNLYDAKSDGNVDLEEAKNIMKMVGVPSTLHTTIFEPDYMKMHIYLSEPGKGAFEFERHDFNFSDLF